MGFGNKKPKRKFTVKKKRNRTLIKKQSINYDDQSCRNFFISDECRLDQPVLPEIDDSETADEYYVVLDKAYRYYDHDGLDQLVQSESARVFSELRENIKSIENDNFICNRNSDCVSFVQLNYDNVVGKVQNAVYVNKDFNVTIQVNEQKLSPSHDIWRYDRLPRVCHTSRALEYILNVVDSYSTSLGNPDKNIQALFSVELLDFKTKMPKRKRKLTRLQKEGNVHEITDSLSMDCDSVPNLERNRSKKSKKSERINAKLPTESVPNKEPMNISTIHGIPVNMPFSMKFFIPDTEKILESKVYVIVELANLGSTQLKLLRPIKIDVKGALKPTIGNNKSELSKCQKDLLNLKDVNGKAISKQSKEVEAEQFHTSSHNETKEDRMNDSLNVEKESMENDLWKLSECRKNLSKVLQKVGKVKESAKQAKQIGEEHINKSDDNVTNGKLINEFPCNVKQSIRKQSFPDGDLSDHMKIGMSSVKQLKDWSNCQDASAVNDHLTIDTSSMRKLKDWTDSQIAEPVSDHLKINMSSVRQLEDWSDSHEAEPVSDHLKIDMSSVRHLKSWSDCQEAEPVSDPLKIDMSSVRQLKDWSDCQDAEPVSDHLKIDMSSVRQLKDWSDCQNAEPVSDQSNIDISSVRQLKDWYDCQDAEPVSDHLKIDMSSVRQLEDWSDCQEEEPVRDNLKIDMSSVRQLKDWSDCQDAEPVSDPLKIDMSSVRQLKDWSDCQDAEPVSDHLKIDQSSVRQLKDSSDYQAEGRHKNSTVTMFEDWSDCQAEERHNNSTVRMLEEWSGYQEVERHKNRTVRMLVIKRKRSNDLSNYENSEKVWKRDGTTQTSKTQSKGEGMKKNSKCFSYKYVVNTGIDDTNKPESDSNIYKSSLNLKSEPVDEPVLSSAFVHNYNGENNIGDIDNTTVTVPKEVSTIYQSILNIKTEPEDESEFSSAFVSNDHYGKNKLTDSNSTTVTDPKGNLDGISNRDDRNRTLNCDTVKSDPNLTLHESFVNEKSNHDDNESLLPSCNEETSQEVQERDDGSSSSKTEKVILCYRNAREKEQDPDCTETMPKLDIGYFDIGKGEVCYEFYDRIAVQKKLENIPRLLKVKRRKKSKIK